MLGIILGIRDPWKKNLKSTRSLHSRLHLGGSVVERLLLAQVVIPDFWDQVLHQASLRESASPSAYVSASLCVSLMNK